jgi:hypothetical protein
MAKYKKKKKKSSSSAQSKKTTKLNSKRSLVKKFKKLKLKSSKTQLDQMARYKDELAQANKALDKLLKSGYQSLALDRLRAETRDRDIHFSFPEEASVTEMAKELFRARAFMADDTSTVKGAEEYTHQLENEFRGAFGNQWRSAYGVAYDKARVDDEIAKVVFSNYRKIEELKQYAIVGEGGFGSENLIVAMYNAEVYGKNSLIYAKELLDKHYLAKQKEYKSLFSTASPKVISGQSEDYTDEDEQDYINRRDF